MRSAPSSRRHKFLSVLTLKVDCPPPTAAGVEAFSHDSIGHFRPCSVFNPARVLHVAGYVCCIGIVPMYVFPAIFPVAFVSVVISSVAFCRFSRLLPRVVCVGAAQLRASASRPREETPRLIGSANRGIPRSSAIAVVCWQVIFTQFVVGRTFLFC